MDTLFAANSNAPRTAPKASRGLYTYAVTPLGPITTVADEDGRRELTMRAALRRGDGTERRHLLRVRATEAQPDMVERFAELAGKGVDLRLVVRLESVPGRDGAGNPHLRVQAVAETILEPRRGASLAQLDLFG